MAALTVIIALFGIFQNYSYLKKKKLLFLLGQSFSLVNIKDNYKDKIKVLYDNIQYNDLSSIQITIINSGNLEILKEDLRKPIQFSFDEHIKIIDWRKISSKPEGLIVNISRVPNTEVNLSINNEFYCDFELLNPESEIKVQFVCVGGEIKDPKINAPMIKGTKVNTMMYEKYLEEKNYSKNILNYCFTVLFGFGLMWLTTFTTNPYIIFSSFVFGTTIIFVSSILIIYFSWRPLIKTFFSYLKEKIAK